MIDYAILIKQQLTMFDVLHYYGLAEYEHRRIPCPLHSGCDLNFSFKDDFFHCFVCGESGDLITFVQKYFSLSFMDAVKKLNDDFNLNLPLNHKISLRQKREIEKNQRERQNKRLQDDLLMKEYHNALDEYIRLDKQFNTYKPKSPDEELNPLFVEALQKRETASQKLDEVEVKFYENRR